MRFTVRDYVDLPESMAARSRNGWTILGVIDEQELQTGLGLLRDRLRAWERETGNSWFTSFSSASGGIVRLRGVAAA